MNITKNTVVTINYTLKDNDGKTIDASDEGDPLVYLHGAGHLLPALESQLEGKCAGDSIQVTLAPEDGYGVRDDRLTQVVPKSQFQDDAELEVGVQFQVDTENGPMVLTVTDVQKDDVVVDANHPLAGVTLNFEVQVVETRSATAEELAHGHAHGPGGHDH